MNCPYYFMPGPCSSPKTKTLIWTNQPLSCIILPDTVKLTNALGKMREANI